MKCRTEAACRRFLHHYAQMTELSLCYDEDALMQEEGRPKGGRALSTFDFSADTVSLCLILRRRLLSRTACCFFFSSVLCLSTFFSSPFPDS